ncbi:protein FAM166B [Chelmon rostratus]|uniref:protein FAM166B n=1 Tax=Chelmon rostratus TaxID=109905 RepID=UPI001BE5C17F|nr:protein FAM166B [Chelmon rostratus]
MEKYGLLTPEPHYIPGYTGHCPQLRWGVGKSYSKLTAELLTSTEVKHTSRLVLRRGHAPPTESDLILRGIPDTDSKKTIPGYTGWIPRRQNYFACTYTETCRKVLSEFYQDRCAKTHWRSTDLPAVVNNHQCERPKPPLTAISDTVITYEPLKPPSSTTPDDDDPRKYFISGFLVGKGYPIMTNQALIQFGKQQRSDPKGQKDSTITPLPKIYPSNRGVVPSFTGHIPGYRFMYGHTFGQLSKNALEKRIFQEKSQNHQTLQ